MLAKECKVTLHERAVQVLDYGCSKNDGTVSALDGICNPVRNVLGLKRYFGIVNPIQLSKAKLTFGLLSPFPFYDIPI